MTIEPTNVSEGLVERLRLPIEIGYAVPMPVFDVLQRAVDERGEAADEIERLRAEIATLSPPSPIPRGQPSPPFPSMED